MFQWFTIGLFSKFTNVNITKHIHKNSAREVVYIYITKQISSKCVETDTSTIIRRAVHLHAFRGRYPHPYIYCTKDADISLGQGEVSISFSAT